MTSGTRATARWLTRGIITIAFLASASITQATESKIRKKQLQTNDSASVAWSIIRQIRFVQRDVFDNEHDDWFFAADLANARNARSAE